MKKLFLLLVMAMGLIVTSCGSDVKQILEKPAQEVGTEDVSKLIACIEEINVPAQEHIKAQAWSSLVDFVESNQEKFDLAAECYAKLNTLGPEQLVDTSAHEAMQQFATLVSVLGVGFLIANRSVSFEMYAVMLIFVGENQKAYIYH